MITELGTTAANKDTVQRLFAALDREGMEALLAPGFRAHGMPPGCSPDADGLKECAGLMHAGLQECQNKIEDVIAEADRVAVRYTTRAVHGGRLFGIPPSGRRITMTGIEVYRVIDGQVAEMWSEADMSQLFATEGDTTAVPAPA